MRSAFLLMQCIKCFNGIRKKDMALVSVATITAIAKVSSPIISDIYSAAKGKVKTALSRWEEQQFPKRLAKKIGNLSLVRTLWCPDDDVSLLKFYYPPKVQATGTSTEIIANCVNDISTENFVIQGIVGQGKSIFLRWLAVQEAKMSRLPIFIELRTLHAKYSLRDAIYRELESFDITINEEVFNYLAKSGKFLLLLDAFDELDSNLTKETLNEIKFLSRKFESMQIVISSRPGNEIQKISGIKVMNICPLSEIDYAPFLEKMGLTAIKSFEVVTAIKESKGSLIELITTPLMLTLVAIVYQSEREIPNTLPEFFEKLFHIVLTRHDRLKDGFNRKRNSGLSDRKLQELFEAFCFMTLQNGYGRSLSNEQFTHAFKNAQNYTENCKCEQENFQIDIIKGACLMLEEGIDTSTFLHKSLLEYYAAAFIKHSNDDVAKLFYEEAQRPQTHWYDVINFLSNIDPYRFSKFFALPQIEITKNNYTQHLAKKDIKWLTKTFTKHTKEPCLYVEDSKGKLHIGIYHLILEPTFYTEKLNQLHLDFMWEKMPGTIKKEDIESTFQLKIDPSPEKHRIAIPFKNVLNYIGEEEYWLLLLQYEQWLNQQQRTAEEKISIHDKRKNIFIRDNL